MASAKHFYYARTCVHTRCTRVRHACAYDRRGPLISPATPIVNNCRPRRDVHTAVGGDVYRQRDNTPGPTYRGITRRLRR